MNRYIKYFFVIISVAFLLISCNNKKNNLITDIIPHIKLIAGETDTVIVSDLFYSESYEIDLVKEKNIDVSFEKEKLLAAFTPNMEFEGITTVDFQFNEETYSILVYSKKINKYKFSYKPNKNFKSISLFGSFNGWNRQDLPMSDKDGDGIYEISVPLESGNYQYKFFADGEEILDPENKIIVPNGLGGYNSVFTIPSLHNEKIFLHKRSYKSTDENSEFQFFLESESGIKPNVSNVIALIDNQKISREYFSFNNSYINLSLPKDKLVNAKMLRVVVSIGGLNSNLQMIPLDNGKPADGQSFSWYDGTIYSLMIDRFYDGNTKINSPIKHDSLSWKTNYMGGDFIGIIQKINEGYFDSLSINTIWLSPVYDNPDEAYKEYPAPHRWFTGYHGYWPIDPERVEEKFGTFDDLKNLISIAHKHRMKVLLDFVSHHVHQEHSFYKEHKDWFGKLELPDGSLNLRLWDEQRLTTWFEPYLPSFDFLGSEEAINVMTDNAIWWLKQTGADGFRHDAVKHVPNKFWRTLTKKLKKEIEQSTSTKVYQIGETFGNYDLVSSYVNNGQLSAQFNFELYNTAQAVFIDPKRSFKDLDMEMNKTFDVYGTLHLMGNIMDSHDKNRFMVYTDGDLDLSQWSAIEVGWNNPPKVDNPSSYKKAVLYYAYMFCVPGVPVVYYGSEFGMTGASDPDNRRIMRFNDQLDKNEKNMLSCVSRIIKIRSEHSSLRYGDYNTLLADDKIYAFIRSDFYERVLIVLNKTEKSQSVELKIPAVYSANKAVNLKNNSTISLAKNKLSLSLKPYDWVMIKLE